MGDGVPDEVHVHGAMCMCMCMGDGVPDEVHVHGAMCMCMCMGDGVPDEVGIFPAIAPPRATRPTACMHSSSPRTWPARVLSALLCAERPAVRAAHCLRSRTWPPYCSSARRSVRGLRACTRTRYTRPATSCSWCCRRAGRHSSKMPSSARQAPRPYSKSSRSSGPTTFVSARVTCNVAHRRRRSSSKLNVAHRRRERRATPGAWTRRRRRRPWPSPPSAASTSCSVSSNWPSPSSSSRR